jgi:hypothetical protein
MSDAPISWKCKNGHVLGQVQRNGSGIRQLAVYREAISVEDPRDDVDVLGVTNGWTEVRCSICGEIRTWVPGDEEIRRLLESRKNRMPIDVNAEMEKLEAAYG